MPQQPICSPKFSFVVATVFFPHKKHETTQIFELSRFGIFVPLPLLFDCFFNNKRIIPFGLIVQLDAHHRRYIIFDCCSMGQSGGRKRIWLESCQHFHLAVGRCILQCLVFSDQRIRRIHEGLCCCQFHHIWRIRRPGSLIFVHLFNWSPHIKKQGFIGILSSQSAVYVVFRGSSSIQDFINDVNIALTTYAYCKGCEVHAGFYALVKDMLHPITFHFINCNWSNCD